MTSVYELVDAPLHDFDRPPSSFAHVLMPNMLYACGGSMIEVGGRFTVGISDWAAVDCLGCREHGIDKVRQVIHAQQVGS